VRAGTSSGADVFEGDERWYEFSLKFDPSFRKPDRHLLRRDAVVLR